MSRAYLDCGDELVSHELDSFEDVMVSLSALTAFVLDDCVQLHDLVSQAIDRPVVHGFSPQLVSLDVFLESLEVGDDCSRQVVDLSALRSGIGDHFALDVVYLELEVGLELAGLERVVFHFLLNLVQQMVPLCRDSGRGR